MFSETPGLRIILQCPRNTLKWKNLQFFLVYRQNILKYCTQIQNFNAKTSVCQQNNVFKKFKPR